MAATLSLYFWLGAEAENYVVLLTGRVISRVAADLATEWLRRDLQINCYA
jgi:hypothetical protein